MSDVSQIVTLVGHVGLFQNIDFTPDQQRGEKQHCDKTSVNHMRRASQVVALFNFNRSGLSIFLSQYVAQTSRRQRPGLCRYPGRFQGRTRGAVTLRFAMLLSSATQAAHRLNARQHHRADDKTQHQVGDDRQRGGHHPTQPRAPVLDGMMQRRNTVNDYPPPTRNMASVPTMDNTFIRRGATARSPLPSHCASALRFSASQ